MAGRKPKYKSNYFDENAKREIGKRVASIREGLKGKNGKTMTQDEFYTWITGTESMGTSGAGTAGGWERGETVNFDALVDISKKTGVSLDWLVFGDDEERQQREESERTLRDYCRLLFVDMADKFHTTWSLSDESILHFAPQCDTAYIRYEIPLHMEPEINEVTGYPSGTYYPTKQDRYMAECANGMKELRNAFSQTHVNKDIVDKAYNAVLNDVPDESIDKDVNAPFYSVRNSKNRTVSTKQATKPENTD